MLSCHFPHITGDSWWADLGLSTGQWSEWQRAMGCDGSPGQGGCRMWEYRACAESERSVKYWCKGPRESVCTACPSGTGNVQKECFSEATGVRWRVPGSWGLTLFLTRGHLLPTSHRVGHSLGNIQSEHMLLLGWGGGGVLGRRCAGSGDGGLCSQESWPPAMPVGLWPPW